MNTQSSKKMEKEKDDDFDFFKQNTKNTTTPVESPVKKSLNKFLIPMSACLLILGITSVFISMDKPIIQEGLSPISSSKTIATPLPPTTSKAPTVEIQIEPPTLEQEKQLDDTIKGLKDIGQQIKQTQAESDKVATEIKKKLERQNKN